MKLVKFKDGTFGVKRGRFFHSEFYSGRYWWSSQENIAKFCKKSEKEARRLLALLDTSHEEVE